MPDEEEQDPKTKPFSLRTLLFILGGIIIIGGIWYGYYLLSSTEAKIAQAEQVIQKASDFDSLSEKIQEEYHRCQAFIAQEQGQFGEFQYCQNFIQWVDANTSVN